jgi:hypothetical protein
MKLIMANIGKIRTTLKSRPEMIQKPGNLAKD